MIINYYLESISPCSLPCAGAPAGAGCGFTAEPRRKVKLISWELRRLEGAHSHSSGLAAGMLISFDRPQFQLWQMFPALRRCWGAAGMSQTGLLPMGLSHTPGPAFGHHFSIIFPSFSHHFPSLPHSAVPQGSADHPPRCPHALSSARVSLPCLGTATHRRVPC